MLLVRLASQVLLVHPGSEVLLVLQASQVLFVHPASLGHLLLLCTCVCGPASLVRSCMSCGIEDI